MKSKIIRTRYEIGLWLILGIAMLAYIAMAIGAGGDVNWDFRDYHFYNGYKALHGGGAHDFFPAQIQTWLNPALDILTVFAMEHMPPVGVAILIAFIQSLNIPLLAFILQRTLMPVIADTSPRFKAVAAMCVMAAAITAPMTLSELGATFGDLEVSVLALGSLAALMVVFARVDKKAAAGKILPLIAIAGLCAGLAAGLKLTYLIYLPGFAVMFLFLRQKPQIIVMHICVFGVACAIGGLITGGPWAWMLWQQTGNPVFPALNGLFHSPLIDQSNIIIDQRFYARTFLDALAFPFLTAIGDHPGAEPFFADPRFAIATALLPILLFHRIKGWPAALTVFFYVSYALWLPAFGIERYIVLLELLSPLVVALMISLIAKPPQRPGFMIGISLLMIVMTAYPDWINRVPWSVIGTGDNWFSVSIPDDLQQPDEMFVTVGELPMTFVIPHLPSDARFVRLGGDFEPSPQSKLFQMRAEAVMAHRGPMYLLTSQHPEGDEFQVMASYGRFRAYAPCENIASNFETLVACPLQLNP